MKRYEQTVGVVTLLIGVAVVALVCGLWLGSRIVPKAYTFAPVTPATSSPPVTAVIAP